MDKKQISRKYAVNLYQGTNAYNAGSKAIADFLKILKDHEYEILSFRVQAGKSKPVKMYHLLKDLWKGYRHLPQNADAVYVYPDILQYDYLFPLLSLKKHRKTAIVCDIDSLRRDEGILSEKDLKQLQRFDRIILHTPAMKQVLVRAGIPENRIETIGLFDYLTVRTNDLPKTKEGAVCYAGNLDKSYFLRELPRLHRLRPEAPPFLLYGIPSENVPLSDRIIYKGKFHPDDPGELEGGWGLVWDGETAETCSGAFGRYLRVNIPHKTCLYLAAGIPVIIWKEAALAPLIEKERLGIAVESLYDLPETLSRITGEQYAAMLRNAAHYSRKLRAGEMLGNLI